MLFSTKYNKLLIAGGAVAFLALFYVVTYPDLESGSESVESQNERWELGVVERPQQPDVEALLAGGLWGATLSTQLEEATDQPLELLAEEEAAVIRKRIVGIVSSEGGSDRLAVIYEAERLVAGDVLPGTNWELVSVSRDRLILNQSGQNPKELRLFYDSTFTIDTGDESATEEEEIQQ